MYPCTVLTNPTNPANRRSWQTGRRMGIPGSCSLRVKSLRRGHLHVHLLKSAIWVSFDFRRLSAPCATLGAGRPGGIDFTFPSHAYLVPGTANSGFRAGDTTGGRRIDQQATVSDLRTAYAAIPEVAGLDAAQGARDPKQLLLTPPGFLQCHLLSLHGIHA